MLSVKKKIKKIFVLCSIVFKFVLISFKDMNILSELRSERLKLKAEMEKVNKALEHIEGLIAFYSITSFEEPNTVILAETKGDNEIITSKAGDSTLKGWSLKDSVKNVVLSLKSLKKSTDITHMLLELYPEKRNSLLNFQVQVSGILSDWGKTGEIKKYQYSSSKKDTLWGGPSLFDESGNPYEIAKYYSML